ncbi:hypothetical protein WN944_018101 [Citrus x changshan-huyou]|uniref:Uncharacterized protein n=1 Tax=Citrus x changshan-huyou TaxID=2935761 RepID=A0AAP0LSR9_9ROSI
MHAAIKRGREIDAYRSMQPVVTNQEPVIEQHEASRPEETTYIDCPFLQERTRISLQQANFYSHFHVYEMRMACNSRKLMGPLQMEGSAMSGQLSKKSSSLAYVASAPTPVEDSH